VAGKEGLMKEKGFYMIVLFLFIVASSSAFAKEAAYHIGPGDTLEISVWKDESLSRNMVVPPDGVIAFPLVGDIDVTNLTVADLRKEVTTRLSEYVPDATVTVMLVEINSLKAYVIGKVNRPGEFPITLETTVVQILSMAVVAVSLASAGNIHILRQKKNDSVKIPFDYKQIEKGKNLEQNIVLERGDVVVVP